MTIHQAMPPLRILHVFRAPLGGLFRHVLDLAREQASRGYDVGMFCDSSIGNAVSEKALADIAPSLSLGIFRTPIHRNPAPLADLDVLRKLARVRAKTGATILHGHGAKGGAYARLLPVPRGAGRVARIYTPHGGSFNHRIGSFEHRVYMAAEALMARRTDLLTFESAFIADRFRTYVGGFDERVRVIYNGVSDAEFEPVDTNAAAFDLLYVGELRAAKGIDTLLQALVRLRDSGRRTTLLAVGSGPEAEALAVEAKRLGLGDDIRFEPPQQIRAVFGRGRVMVVPSRAESLPYVVLEAAAGRQPLVSTDVGGIPEIFGPFADRLIAPDDPELMARAIEASLDESHEERAAFAERLAGYVHTRFRLATMADAVIAGYAQALGAGDAATQRQVALNAS